MTGLVFCDILQQVCDQVLHRELPRATCRGTAWSALTVYPGRPAFQAEGGSDRRSGASAGGGEVFIPGLSDSSGDDVEEGEVRGEAPPPTAAAKATTLAGETPDNKLSPKLI